MERLPREERHLLLELAGATRAELRAATEAEVLDALTSIAIATRFKGTTLVSFAGRVLTIEVDADGTLLHCAELDPLRPRGAGLVSALPEEERPTAFALIVSLAGLGEARDGAGRRDLVSLVSRALGDALTRR